MTKPQDKRRHHFTPILYLRNFTDSKGELHVVRREDGKRFDTGPKGIGFEKDLCWPDSLEEGEDPNVYENQFADFEGKAVPVIEEIILKQVMPTDDDALGLLFNFIAFQMVRTPSMRRVIAAPQEHAARIIIDMLESSKELYESHMRRAGYSLDEHPWEKLQRTKGKYEPRLTTEGFIEGAMTMMTTMLQYLHRRSWSVLVSERPTESFVVSDHPVVLEWSDGRSTRYPPGHAHKNTELTFPLSSNIALLGCYEPFTVEQEMMPVYVSGINSRTINLARVFVAACEDRFILQDAGQIITAEQFVEQLKHEHAKDRSQQPAGRDMQKALQVLKRAGKGNAPIAGDEFP
ncbi:MAG: DUF4238 domain-containing protein [Acidobacteria bacterium]|nr:DUF4238 domain-containing protein [Acidobacteriota bacterium]